MTAASLTGILAPLSRGMDEMAGAPSPKELIEQELAKASPDWRIIERLSRYEVDAAPTNVRFSVDAGHIQRLGQELVAKPESALTELIKNAYDADATHVTLTFRNHDRLHGELIVADNGCGMTADTIRDAWMRISTTSKQDQARSPRFGRIRAGRKGIGRFAVQRLGKRLLLETEVSGTEKGIRVSFDWDADFRAGRDLYDVFSSASEYEKPVDRSGTRLIISDLRESWPEQVVSRVWKAVLLLQPPFRVAAIAARPDGTIPDPGFEVSINGTTSRQHQSELSLQTTFLNHAIAEISGAITPDGSAWVRLVSEKLGLDDRHDYDGTKFLLTGPVTFSTRYFVYGKGGLSGISARTASEIGRTYGGIRIYRNGFRVLPYGEPHDDWLRLDDDSGRRSILVTARNMNFFGEVALDANVNSALEETSSREGLIENEAFRELQKFVRQGVEWAVTRVGVVRERKTKASQPGFVSKLQPQKPSEAVRELAPQVVAGIIEEISDKTCSSRDESNSVQNSLHSMEVIEKKVLSFAETVLEKSKTYEDYIEQERRDSIEYEEMLRVLASLGLSVATFGHEISGSKEAMIANMTTLSQYVDRLLTPQERMPLQQKMSLLQQTATRIFHLGGYINTLMSHAESRELKPISLRGAIERFLMEFSNYLSGQSIEVVHNLSSAPLRTTEMHASELDAVLLNFLTNSVKSIKKAKVSPRRIRISTALDGNHVLLSFEDNGNGVPPEIADRIFDPFFTTTMTGDDDGAAGPGTGLGLKIVSDIACTYGGSVILGVPEDGYNCCFEFRVLSFTKRSDQ
ncbi:hypothetical protein GAY31_22680 [Azospirillum brasilense]|nr:hypothetical protein [Azospirillum brasilense]